MSRTDERQAALRFCFVVVGWLACLFGWASVLSFNVADAPSTSVWPHPTPPHNLCGTAGAYLAFYVFTIWASPPTRSSRSCTPR